ncbi:MAG TPA: hypothetical protein VMU24_08460 [Candidatus Acidoferrales bacterium]|nr:hypothetical protein [Candidatus Acidoferrales bacterium]
MFESRTSKAKEVLDSARALPEICPEWFLEMQSVALNQGWPKEGKAELLKSAISFEPGYYYYYREHALSLLPKWDGEPGEVEKFIADSSDRIGGAEGDILYFRVASFLSGEREVFEKLSFRRIRQGFTQSERVYGVSLTNMNLFAYMAWIFQEAGVADPIFKRIGDQWSEDPFGSEATFENGKKWAAQFAEIIPDTSDLEEKMKTPEGQRYDAEFRTKFADLIQSCLEKADAAEGPVRLLASIAGDGTISTMRTLQGNSKGVCLFQAGHQKLSPPSHAPFQILLTFNIPLQTAPK